MLKSNKIPQILDILEAVRALDKCKKSTPEREKAHKLAVKQVEEYNGFHGHGDGSMSISGARQLIQIRTASEKRKVKWPKKKVGAKNDK